jgi:hypothetical protein
MNTNNVIDALSLVIVMAGDQFDGHLAFNALVLSDFQTSLPLDIKSSKVKFVQQNTETTLGTYVLECTFTGCAKELKEIFGDKHSYDELLGILTSESTFGLIDLSLLDNFKDSMVNIGRIKSMFLQSDLDKELIIPVQHCANLDV